MTRNSLFIFLGMSVMVALISSCGVTNKYTTPEIDNSYLFRLDSLASGGEKISTVEWQDFFKDSLLKGYIQKALDNNFDNLVAYKNIEKFEVLARQGKAGNLPTLNLKADAQRQKQAGNSSFGSFFSEPFTQYNLSAGVSWEADLWGKIKSQRLMTEAQFAQSVTAQKLLQTTIISNVAKVYYQLLENDKRKEVLMRTVEIRTQSVETLKSLKAAGKSNQLAIDQAVAQLQQANILLTSVEEAIFRSENALVQLAGLPITDIKRSVLDEMDLSREFQLAMPVEILSNRPDVKEAELAFRSLFENHNMAIASMYPTLNLSVDFGLQSIDISKWLNPASFFNTITGGITQPVFDRRRLKTQKQVTRIDMEQSLLRFQQKVLDAGLEVSNLMKTYEIQSRNLLALQGQEALLEKSFEDSKEMMTYGFANYLDVLIAQENLLNAQLQSLQVASGKLQTSADLYRAVGGGVR